MSIPPTISYIPTQKPSDIFVDQQNAKNVLGIIDNRLAELYTVAQLFPDYRKTDPDPSKPTIDFRFSPIRTTGEGVDQSTTLDEATSILSGALSPSIIAFLNDPASKNNPLYPIMTTTLNVLGSVLATAENASLDVVAGSPLADRAQNNSILPYMAIKSVANEGGPILEMGFSLVSSLPVGQQDSTLNILNQLEPLTTSFTQIVGELEAGNQQITGKISQLALQTENLQQQLTNKSDVGIPFINTFIDQLQTATLSLSIGVGLASALTNTNVALFSLGKHESSSGFLSPNTLPVIKGFSEGLLNGTGATLGQQALFSNTLALTSFTLLSAVKALEGGIFPVPDGIDTDSKTYTTFLFDNISKGFLASDLVGLLANTITNVSGVQGDATKMVADTVKFALLASIVYAIDDNKIKENFFAQVKDSLEEIAQNMKEADQKSRISSDEMTKVNLHKDEIFIGLKNNDVTGFCAGCDNLLEAFDLSKTTFSQDIQGTQSFGTFIFDTLAEETENQKTISATSFSSSA